MTEARQPGLTFREFLDSVQGYWGACREHDGNLLLLFGLSLLPLLIALEFAVLAVSLVGIHILWNTRKFYRKVAPKCPSCNSTMHDVDGLMMIMGLQYVERPTPIHCMHCENVIVFWNDVRQPG